MIFVTWNPSKRMRLYLTFTFYIFVGMSLRGQAGDSLATFTLLVQYQDSQTSMEAPVSQRSIKWTRTKLLSEDLGIRRFDFITEDDLEAMELFLGYQPGVLRVQRNRKFKTRSRIPNDPFYPQQWNLERIGLPLIWDVTTGGITPCGDTIVIAVFDAGLDISHSDLQLNFWRNPQEIPYNGFDDDQNGYIDDYLGLNLDTGNDDHHISSDYHGTAVTSVIGAVGNNNIGIAGINWNVKLLVISSLEKDEANVIEAFEYIKQLRIKYDATGGQEGAYVVAVNNSWGHEGGFAEDFPMTCEMFNSLGEVGIINVGATENDQVNTDIFGDIPSDCSSDYLIIVTNTDQQDNLSIAGWGRNNVDLGAPGESIYAASPADKYRTQGGTSFAAPHVTGAIGLLYSLPGSDFCDVAKISPTEAIKRIKTALLSGVTPLPSLEDRTVSGGRLDLSKTVELITQSNDTEIQDDIRVFPNPAGNTLNIQTISLDEMMTQIEILDIIGKSVYADQGPVPGSITQIKLHAFPNGLYALKLTTSKRTYSTLFIKSASQ